MNVSVSSPLHQRMRLSWLLNDRFLEPLFVVFTLAGIVAGSMLRHGGASETTLVAIATATYLFGSVYAVRAIVAALRERQVEVDLLMVLAALGAAYVGAWTEGAMLLFLFSLSNVLQSYAMHRTERAISSLLELRPDTVTIRRDGHMVRLALDAVAVGDIVVLRPGERVALDGIIVRGSGVFDESSVTGESIPVIKEAGSQIFAGTVNQTGALDVAVSKPAAESTLARMITLVSEARERKARSQSLLDRFEQIYALGVIGAVALYIALVPWLFNMSFGDTLYRAMVLLTVASPCALVISVPASFLSAIANGARHGILFKGGAHLEALTMVQVVAFDKTGTLTVGRPDVMDVLPSDGVTAVELLAAVARAEQSSDHPIARAIRTFAAAQGIDNDEPEQFAAITGMGVRAVWDGEETLVGSPQLMAHLGRVVPSALLREVERLANEGRGTALLVWRGERCLGIVTVMDRVRSGAAEKIAALRAAGVKRIVMLTGDNAQVADAIGRAVGVDEVHAALLPADKLRIVEELQRHYGPTAMVGDGINDAPALAAARVGIAMGAAGTDVAMETADIVLMADDLQGVADAVLLSKRAQRIVRQNIVFALAVVVVLVASTLGVGIPLPIGVIGHEGSTLLVVLNGLRLLRR